MRKNTNGILDLVGIGIGPFNLSLAALLEKAPKIKSLFLDKKPEFDWHPEIMFQDSMMQTTYLTDLVTPVDPTSVYSFLNYISENHLFYHFLNTERKVISRKEFELYCSWVSRKLEKKLNFNSEVQDVTFSNDAFHIFTQNGEYKSKNICVATGLMPYIPTCAQKFLGQTLFHAKSNYIKTLNLNNKSVMIVGGGQTGIEVFRNALHGKWGKAHAVRLLTSRQTCEQLDESAFVSEYFTPTYVNEFFDLQSHKKDQVVESQKFASDGNTASYLLDLYNDLYRVKYVEGDNRDLRFFAFRRLLDIDQFSGGFRLTVDNTLQDCKEEFFADVVILCTGFSNSIPKLLSSLSQRIHFDGKGRFNFKKSYAIEWDGPEGNKIYALNFSRHNHGIVDPQTSLMAWRSAVIINDLSQKNIYRTTESLPNFVDYKQIRDDVYSMPTWHCESDDGKVFFNTSQNAI